MQDVLKQFQKKLLIKILTRPKRTYIHDNSFVFRHPGLYSSLHFRLFQCSCQSYVLQVNMADSLETIVAQKWNSSFDSFAKKNYNIIYKLNNILQGYFGKCYVCCSMFLHSIAFEKHRRKTKNVIQSDNKLTILVSHSWRSWVLDK